MQKFESVKDFTKSLRNHMNMFEANSASVSFYRKIEGKYAQFCKFKYTWNSFTSNGQLRKTYRDEIETFLAVTPYVVFNI